MRSIISQVGKEAFKDFMKRAIRGYISKSIHEQSMQSSAKPFAALFTGSELLFPCCWPVECDPGLSNAISELSVRAM